MLGRGCSFACEEHWKRVKIMLYWFDGVSYSPPREVYIQKCFNHVSPKFVWRTLEADDIDVYSSAGFVPNFVLKEVR